MLWKKIFSPCNGIVSTSKLTSDMVNLMLPWEVLIQMDANKLKEFSLAISANSFNFFRTYLTGVWEYLEGRVCVCVWIFNLKPLYGLVCSTVDT